MMESIIVILVSVLLVLNVLLFLNSSSDACVASNSAFKSANLDSLTSCGMAVLASILAASSLIASNLLELLKKNLAALGVRLLTLSSIFL